MPEDAGKKRIIRELLQLIKNGAGFIPDLWIEREIKEPTKQETSYSTAESLRGQPISTITELLEDDIKNTFDDRFFTFRFIAAKAGSGKTSLLGRFQELINTNPKYYTNSVVVDISFPELFSISGNQNFGVKIYLYILVETFWSLFSKYPVLHHNVIDATKDFLKSILKEEQFAQVQNAIYSKKTDGERKIDFSNQLTEYLIEKTSNFENIFFGLIDSITSKNPLFTFVYLIDEFGPSGCQEQDFNEARIIFRTLINRVYNKYKGTINLMMYLVGISAKVETFVKGDAGLERRVFDTMIYLMPLLKKECSDIQKKITGIIKDAYSGCSDFKEALSKIEQIDVEPGRDCATLGEFCKIYGGKILKIHEQHFKHFDKSFNIYETNARNLVKAECIKQWDKFLKKSGYQLSVATSTTSITFYTKEGTKTHAFDCYVQLLHNSEPVARAFGEAKNCNLLTGYMTTFEQWLKDAEFKPSSDDKNIPHDLAFIIAPSCAPLSKRKLELKNIQYIEAPKILDPDNAIKKDNSIENPTTPTESTNPPEENSKPETEIQPSSNGELRNEDKSPKIIKDTVNINKASKDQLVEAFKGTGIKGVTIDSIIKRRQTQPYTDLNDIFSHFKSKNVKDKLQAKFDNGEISF